MPSTASTLRAALAGLVALAIALAFVGLVGARQLHEYHEREVSERLRKAIEILEPIATPALKDPATAHGELERVAQMGALTGLRLTVIEPDGTVLADSEVRELPNVAGRPELVLAEAHGFGTAERTSAVTGKHTVYFDKRIDRPDGRVLGHVRAALETETVSAARAWLESQSWSTLVAAFALGTTVLVILTQRELKRLRVPSSERAGRAAVADATRTSDPPAPLPRVASTEHERAA